MKTNWPNENENENENDGYIFIMEINWLALRVVCIEPINHKKYPKFIFHVPSLIYLFLSLFIDSMLWFFEIDLLILLFSFYLFFCIVLFNISQSMNLWWKKELHYLHSKPINRVSIHLYYILIYSLHQPTLFQSGWFEIFNSTQLNPIQHEWMDPGMPF